MRTTYRRARLMPGPRLARPMPVVRFRASDLVRLVGKAIPQAQLASTIPEIGGEVKDASGEEWEVELFPDRPDLFTVEGTARALRQYLGIAPGLAAYSVAAPKHALHVDPSVEGVRPAIAGAFVRGVPMDAHRLEGIIQLQEDLHWGLGARRRRVAIGVHDARALVPPFTYKVVGPHGVRFVPLAKTREMDPAQILAEHEKGKEYAHLVSDGKFPLIVDSKGQVLSLPPIINGTLTTVRPDSRDLFLDVTGTDAWAVQRTLNLLATSLAEAGGRLEAIRLEGAASGTTPDLAPEKRLLDVAYANRHLGSAFTPDEVADNLRKTGFGATAQGARVEVQVPAYRTDIFHDVDLVEDVAIGHGFSRFARADLRGVTTGTPRPSQVLSEKARAALVGQGFLEAMTLSLSSEDDQFAKMGEAAGWAVRVKNPATMDHTMLRARIVPSLLAILAKNTHRDLPQRIFEVGVATVAGAGGLPRPQHRIAGVAIGAKLGFSDVKGVVAALARDLGWAPAGAQVDVEPRSAAWLIEGRAAGIAGRGGVFGEVHPRTVTAFGLAHPTVAFELDLAAERPPASSR